MDKRNNLDAWLMLAAIATSVGGGMYLAWQVAEIVKDYSIL